MILVLIVGQSVLVQGELVEETQFTLLTLVQDTPTYAAVASSSRGPAVVNAKMPLLNNAAADDLESDPGFVSNRGRMSAFERKYYHPNNIMPKRPLSAVFAVNQISENQVKDIFQDLQNIGIHAHCLQRVSNDRFLITFGKGNYRNTFSKKFSFIPHFTDSCPELSTSSNLVYVAAYDTPFEMSDEAIRNPLSQFGVVRSSRLCKLQTMLSIFNRICVFGMEICKARLFFFAFWGVPVSARSTTIRLPPVVSAIDLVIKLGCALICLT